MREGQHKRRSWRFYFFGASRRRPTDGAVELSSFRRNPSTVEIAAASLTAVGSGGVSGVEESAAQVGAVPSASAALETPARLPPTAIESVVAARPEAEAENIPAVVTPAAIAPVVEAGAVRARARVGTRAD